MKKSNDTSRRVLISGCGIAGLTAACAFGDLGWDVTIIERKPQVDDGGGVGLTLVANALRALSTIGLVQQCVDAGISYHALIMRQHTGKVAMESPLPLIGGPDFPACTSISRAKFHAILLAKAKPLSQVRCNLTVDDWQQFDDYIEVVFSDGTCACFDLMVAAEGLYSSTREKLMPDVLPQYTGQAIWRVGLNRPKNIVQTNLYVTGPHGVVGICPISEDDCYVYIVETDDGSWRDRATLDIQMRELLASYGGPVAELAPQIVDPTKVNFRLLEWVLAPKPWGEGRLFMIGDAVHAGPPVIAQGAAMGIEDAIVLAETTTEHFADFDMAREQFLQRRYPRAKHVVDSSCQLAKWEVEKAKNVDVVGVMRRNSEILAEPI
jgi:2-polyprenyl-6-methoxyphenol hydroxylase-like FAD-dependent oxidoreductase